MQHQILQKNITIKSEKFCDFFFSLQFYRIVFQCSYPLQSDSLLSLTLFQKSQRDFNLFREMKIDHCMLGI